jgi:hypothetical protein
VPENNQIEFSVPLVEFSLSGAWVIRKQSSTLVECFDENCREWDGAMVFGSGGAVITIVRLEISSQLGAILSDTFAGQNPGQHSIGHVCMTSIETAGAMQ